ncbi:MAG: hypothetical protein V3V19_11075 [Cocleimonas sp.]
MSKIDGLSADSVKSFNFGGIEYEKHGDFFYDPDIPLNKLNTTDYVFGLKIRYFKPWNKKLIDRIKPPKWFIFITLFIIIIEMVIL